MERAKLASRNSERLPRTMTLELDIEQLAVPGIAPHAREELARAIEQELERLVDRGGLPFGIDLGGIDIGQVVFELAPQPTVAETGTQIARQILAGLHQQTTGRIPPGLTEVKE